MVRNEFKPPSDFVADDTGGGKRNVWKWLGIGCGVIALIIGGLLAFGAWKTVSCCNEMVDSQQQVRQFSAELAGHLAAGEVEQARAKMTDELRSKISAAQLEEQLAQYERLLTTSSGRLSDVFIERKGADESNVWKMTIEFSPPAGREKLVVLIDVVGRGEGEERVYLADRLQFEARSRDIASEPPAVEVLDFHRQLRGGNYEQAYRHMSSDYNEQSDLEAFRSFVRDQQEAFRTGKVEIESVAYSGSGRAAVRARVVGDSGDSAKVEYELVRPNMSVPKWLIASVTPTYELAEPAADTDSAPEAGSESAGSEEAGSEEAGSEEAGSEEAGSEEAGSEEAGEKAQK